MKIITRSLTKLVEAGNSLIFKFYLDLSTL
jgi:hypothetical protein